MPRFRYPENRTWNMLPEEPGVYVLFLEDACVYVGSSINLWRRVKYQRPYIDFDRVEIFECPEDDLAKLEQQYIDLYKPLLNKIKATRIPSMKAMYWTLRLRQAWYKLSRFTISKEVFIMQAVATIQADYGPHLRIPSKSKRKPAAPVEAKAI